MEELQLSEQVVRLLLATGAGMMIGLEREWREKAAGFRTLALVSLGSAVFMLTSASLSPDGPARVAAGVITGIGFLGAGAILRDHGEVFGLTTAAAVWVSAGLGMAAGSGDYPLTLAGLIAALLVLLLFPAIDLTPLVRDARLYEIRYRHADWSEELLARPLASAGLTVIPTRIEFSEGRLVVAWRATGRPSRHREAIDRLAHDDTVDGLSIT